MVTKKKQINSQPIASSKTVSGKQYSSDGMKVIWCFDMLDTSDKFAFDTHRGDFSHKEVLEKIIAYCNMTWSDVKRQTHDDGKSKHHFLDITKLSKEARQRIEAKKLLEYSDAIFSFALQNKMRIIGIRKDEKFHAIWYDPQHQFCPIHKR